MNPNLRVLKVFHIGTTPADDLEVTLSPSLVKAILTKNNIIQDRPVKETTILFLDDSSPMELNLSTLCVLQLEQVIGAYGFQEEF